MKILIVDDETELLTSLERTLKYKGANRVTTCHRASEALSLIQQDHFDLVSASSTANWLPRRKARAGDPYVALP